MYLYICSVEKNRNINFKNRVMTTLEITYKPNSRIGNGIISSNSKMVADITAKEEIWNKYGDQEIANIWAAQILAHRFNEPCTLIAAKVVIK